jgi:ATP-dependent Clp protease ATP-binding subunit ClpB
VRRKPYSVVLLDEIEKAHPDVFNILLQVLDDGQLTDSLRRRVDFKNTVLIMTSNIGSQHLLEGVTAHGTIEDGAHDAVMGELRRHFRPEFLNRVDDTVLFKPLTLDEIQRIVGLMTAELAGRLAARGIRLEISGAARELIARSGFDPVYGARPHKRFILRVVETRVGRALVAGVVAAGSALTIDVDNGALVRHPAVPAAAAAGAPQPS